MRASRLLQMLLLLQNRGRMNCSALARELEVTRRTVLRDVDALTEAGLPIVVIRGNQGGIELGFNYRTRLTGLAMDEAEALSILLSQPCPALDELGLRQAGNRAVAKLVESFPDGVRSHVNVARQRFVFFAPAAAPEPDDRVAAIAEAIRKRNIIIFFGRDHADLRIHPVRLELSLSGWLVHDERHGVAPVALKDHGNINVSALCF